MSSPTDFRTHGKIIEVRDGGGTVVFAPRGTTYELVLKATPSYAGPVNTPVEAILRATARKVWTVPSGGNFVVPIVGPTKIIQGRVKHLDGKQVVIHAGPVFVVDLPSDPSATDGASGALAVGVMANATAFAGARIEIVERAAASSVNAGAAT
jgi:hypothetical protein